MKTKPIKHTSANKMINIIIEWEKQTQHKTFVGLLNHLGLLWDEWVELKETKQPHARVLALYEQHLSEQLEKQLIYGNPRTINTGAIIFLLKKQNPSRYGDEKSKPTNTLSAKKTIFDELENKSEIDLMKIC